MTQITDILDQALERWRLPPNTTRVDQGSWRQIAASEWSTTLICCHGDRQGLHRLPVRAVVSGFAVDLVVFDALGLARWGEPGEVVSGADVAAAAAHQAGIERLTWTDPDTGLMWMREAMDGEHTWSEALALPATLNARGGCAGFADWRLPTVDELKTLVINKDSEGRRFRAGIFTDMSDWFASGEHLAFWSASPAAGSSGRAWFVSFGRGGDGRGLKSYSFRVRLVRGG